METEARFGSSLPVPCVKELAEEQLPSVPERYVRDEQDHPIILSSSSLPQVPVIDLQKLCSHQEESFQFELEKLHHACKDWGFFQLINHGVSTLLVEQVKDGIQELFDLPLEEKKKFWQQAGDVEGFGQAFVVSEGQKLDWGDMYYMLTLPAHMRKPHLFPKLPLPFRDNLEAYGGELKNLALKIFDLVAMNLGINRGDMKEMFEEGFQSMRMNYYPPCPQPELVMGLNAHSDGVALTILLQVNEMEGLQIKKDGVWVPITPLPNAFVINIGDILEMVTNGIYRSIEHRAVANSVKERLSIATFYSPRFDAEIGPAPNLISPETPPLFQKIGAYDYFKGFLARKLDGKAYINDLRIPNSGREC